MIDPTRLRSCYATVRDHLLAERNEHGHWEGELSTSALSTAVAVMALEMVRRSASESKVEGSKSKPQQPRRHAAGSEHGKEEPVPRFAHSPSRGDGATFNFQPSTLDSLVERGLAWLAVHQNPDGGWGDTLKNTSNISTSMLARAVFRATGTEDRYADVIERAVAYCDRIGGVEAVKKRYGKDHTFSVPILTHCALAGLVEWRDIPRLPFELACLPARFYKTVRLPVVSYALPALIAIGQVRHHHHKPWNPITRTLRWLARDRSLKVLERIQPTNGGFLEATPLTSFVTMSLAGMGLADHPVARKGVAFIVASVRDDGSWPIDTNLATWVTTLSINALGEDLPDDARPPLRDWLLGQQYREVHPYTNADPGGWAWTDLPGGVPDADDTPGAMLALAELSRVEGRGSRDQQPRRHAAGPERSEPSDAQPEASPPRGVGAVDHQQSPRRMWFKDEDVWGDGTVEPLIAASSRAAKWLVSIQNRDGGFPTFCRGWGKLPFDRSSADITAHCLRALYSGSFIPIPWDWSPSKWNRTRRVTDFLDEAAMAASYEREEPLHNDVVHALLKGFGYLEHTQRPDGSWYPLWFGNQHDSEEENPTYGTAKVLAAYRDCGRIETEPARRGLEWLRINQNDDGGWGGRRGLASSVEETALATELLVSVDPDCDEAKRGVLWLLERVDGSRVVGWAVPTIESPSDGDSNAAVGTAHPTSPPRGVGAGEPSTIDHQPSTTLNPQHSTLNPAYTPTHWTEPSPIGFYFAKLWYFERLYPVIFTAGALRRAVAAYAPAEK